MTLLPNKWDSVKNGKGENRAVVAGEGKPGRQRSERRAFRWKMSKFRDVRYHVVTTVNNSVFQV